MPVALLAVAILAVGQVPVQVWDKSVGPGLTYHMEYDPNLPRVIHVMKYAPGSEGTQVVIDLAGGSINEDSTVKGKATPSQMVAMTGAVAAINGDYFAADHGAPIGFMVRAGELITTPYKARAVFGWGSGFQLFTPHETVTLTSGNQTLTVDSVNQPVQPNKMHLFTRVAGTVKLPSDSISALLTLPGGKLSPNATATGTVDYLVADKTSFDLPPDKILVVARGSRSTALTSLRQGDAVTIKVDVPGVDFSKLDYAIGGGPYLVRNGVIGVDSVDEGFPDSFSEKRHPRTAIGRDAKGDILVVAVDGRQAFSLGASLSELAQIMVKLGCTDAINLDGGGSTSLNIRGVVVNRPSDKVERPVVNGVLFFADSNPPSDAQPEIVAPTTLTMGASSQLRVMQDGRIVPNADIVWGAQGVAWIDQGGLLRPLGTGSVQVSAYVYGHALTVSLTIGPSNASVPRPGR